jgi:hypothetical protein
MLFMHVFWSKRVQTILFRRSPCSSFNALNTEHSDIPVHKGKSNVVVQSMLRKPDIFIASVTKIFASFAIMLLPIAFG